MLQLYYYRAARSSVGVQMRMRSLITLTHTRTRARTHVIRMAKWISRRVKNTACRLSTTATTVSVSLSSASQQPLYSIQCKKTPTITVLDNVFTMYKYINFFFYCVFERATPGSLYVFFSPLVHNFAINERALFYTIHSPHKYPLPKRPRPFLLFNFYPMVYPMGEFSRTDIPNYL